MDKDEIRTRVWKKIKEVEDKMWDKDMEVLIEEEAINLAIDETISLNRKKVKEIYNKIKDIYTLESHTHSTRISHARDLVRLKYQIQLIKTGEHPLKKCSAGDVVGVIYPDGDVPICELRGAKLTLKDFNYNFYKLWKHKKMEKERKIIETCQCTHGCFLDPMIVYSKRGLFDMIICYFELLSMKDIFNRLKFYLKLLSPKVAY